MVDSLVRKLHTRFAAHQIEIVREREREEWKGQEAQKSYEASREMDATTVQCQLWLVFHISKILDEKERRETVSSLNNYLYARIKTKQLMYVREGVKE